MGKRNPNDQLQTLKAKVAELNLTMQSVDDGGYWGYRILGYGQDITFRPTREGFKRAFDLVKRIEQLERECCKPDATQKNEVMSDKFVCPPDGIVWLDSHEEEA